MKLLRFILIFVFAIGNYAAVAEDGTPPWKPTGRYTHPPIRESSGIVASRQFDGVYWTLNDSGNPATLYATKRDGELIQEITVNGARNVDWEALGIDDKGQLWIGEIGNNSRLRIDLKVVVVVEPNPYTETEAEVVGSYPYRYPEENVDAEGLFITGGLPYIVSKERERAVLYRLPSLQADEKQTLVYVGEFTGAKWITGAGLSTDGTRLAVCTYDALWVYHENEHGDSTQNLAKLIQTEPWVLPHDFRGEAVCFDGYDLVLTNEARDIYALPQLWYEKGWELPPNDTVPVTDGTLQVESYRDAGIDIDGQHVILQPTTATDGLAFSVEAAYKNVYQISTVLTRGPEYGTVKLSINDVVVGQPYNCYHPTPVAGTFVTFGAAPLNAGVNRLVLKNVMKSKKADGIPKIGVDSYQLRHRSTFARQYLVLGPFPRVSLENIDAPLPPESELNLDGTFDGIDSKTVRWQETSAESDGMLDLRKNIGSAPVAVAYALCYVYAPKLMDVTLLLGSDDEVAVWLNGTEIHRVNLKRPAVADEDGIPCQLNAGWNKVLCKIGQSGWTWGLYLRFTDAEGVLKYGTAPE